MDPEKEKSIYEPFPSWTPKNTAVRSENIKNALNHFQTWILKLLGKMMDPLIDFTICQINFLDLFLHCLRHRALWNTDIQLRSSSTAWDSINFPTADWFPLQCILICLQILSSIYRIHENFFLNGKILNSFQNGNTEIDSISSKFWIWNSNVHIIVFTYTHSMGLERKSFLHHPIHT